MLPWYYSFKLFLYVFLLNKHFRMCSKFLWSQCRCPRHFKISELSALAYNVNFFSVSLSSYTHGLTEEEQSKVTIPAQDLGDSEMGKFSFKNKSCHSSFHESFMKDMVYFEHVSLASGGCTQVPAPGHQCIETQDLCAYPVPWVSRNVASQFCTHIKIASAGLTLPTAYPPHSSHPYVRALG